MGWKSWTAITIVGLVLFGAIVGDRKPSEIVMDGDTVRLYVPGNTYVFLGVTDEGYEQMISAENSNSLELLSMLAAKGKVLIVPNGTKAIVLSHGILSSRVTITEGEFFSQDAWIQSSFLKKNLASKDK